MKGGFKMHKMMKSMGVMLGLGTMGFGMYMLMKDKMPDMKMKKTISSPYTCDSQKTCVKSD